MDFKVDFTKILPSFSGIFVGEGLEIVILIPVLIVYLCAWSLKFDIGEEVIQFYIKMILHIVLLLLFSIFSIMAFIDSFTKKVYEYDENEIKTNVTVITPIRALIAASWQWIFFVCHYVFIQFLWGYI